MTQVPSSASGNDLTRPHRQAFSRSWLYTQADIRDQIQRLRGTRNDQSASAIPAGQRATDASLRARLAAALQRNRALADENARLRRQLARALGAERHSR